MVVQLPTVGEYGLEVYANEPIREGDTFTHVCQYLVAFTDRDFGTLYGQVFDRTDLAYGMQATPQLYNSPGGQFATLQAGQGMQQRPGPGQGPPGAYSSQGQGPPGAYPSQYHDGNTLAGRTYRDEMEQGDPYRQQTTQVRVKNQSQCIL